MDDTGDIQIEAGILEGQAVIVSDGSCKDHKGAAGWVIEGMNDMGRIVGSMVVPGAIEDLSSYRSEFVRYSSSNQNDKMHCAPTKV